MVAPEASARPFERRRADAERRVEIAGSGGPRVERAAETARDAREKELLLARAARAR